MKLLATLCCLLLLLCAQAQAQRYLTGRVIDRSDGKGIPGVTVLLKGTTRGILTADDGTYSLPLLPTDSLWLHVQFSSVGYITDTRQLHRPDSVLNAGLNADTREISCKLSISPSAHLRLWSGLRYAPIGAMVVVRRRRSLPLGVTLGYQTNLRRNARWLAELELPRIPYLLGQRVLLEASLRYSRIRAERAALRFSATQLQAVLTPQTATRLPSLWLSTGYTQRATRDVARRGAGYGAGLSWYFPKPGLWVQTTAMCWPGGWQFQGAVRHYFGRLETALLVDKLGPYTEAGLQIGMALYR